MNIYFENNLYSNIVLMIFKNRMTITICHIVIIDVINIHREKGMYDKIQGRKITRIPIKGRLVKH